MCYYGLNNSYRYHAIIIWAHGLEYREEIIQELEQDPDFEILRLQLVKNFDVAAMIQAVYACDTVPLSHLANKTAYLRRLPAYALFIFVKNYAPNEIWTGTHPFRKTQCQKMVYFKNKFRNKYNPRINNTLTHEHIIHTTDYESQADYLLKMLGIKQGVLCFENQLPFHVPFHLGNIEQYTLCKIPIKKLKINMIIESDKGIELYPVFVNDSVHYLGIDNPELYENYLNKFRYIYLKDNYSCLRYKDLQSKNIIEILKNHPVIVKKINALYVILDGSHRAAIAYYAKIETIPCVVVE